MDETYTLDGLPFWLEAEVQAADKLSAQALAADLAGNHAEAERLRDAYDRFYDELEARLGYAETSGGKPAPIPAPIPAIAAPPRLDPPTGDLYPQIADSHPGIK